LWETPGAFWIFDFGFGLRGVSDAGFAIYNSSTLFLFPFALKKIDLTSGRGIA
jgi:hypothetical protein